MRSFFLNSYLNNCVKGFQSGTGILRTRVPGGRRLRRAICVDKFPNSQSYNRKQQQKKSCLKMFLIGSELCSQLPQILPVQGMFVMLMVECTAGDTHGKQHMQ